MKQSTRLLLAFLLAGALMLLLTTAGILSAASMHSALEQSVREGTAATDASRELAVLLERGQGAAYAMALGDPSGASLRRFQETREAFVKQLQAYSATVPPDSADAAMLQQLSVQHERWAAAVQELPKLGNTAVAEAGGVYWTQLEPSARRLSDLLGQLGADRRKLASEAAKHADDLAWRSRTWMATMAAIAVFAMLWLANHLQRSLIEPMSSLAAASLALGTGDTHRRLHHPHDDELGQLARRINDLADQIEAFRSKSRQVEVVEQQLAHALLERFDRACALIDETGALIASNASFRKAVGSAPASDDSDRGAWSANLAQHFELRRLPLTRDSGQPLGELVEILRALPAAAHPDIAQPAAPAS